MPQSIIFITGATGFLGSHVVSQALDAGHKLRLSVRKEAQIETLRTLFSSHADQLEFVVIPDLSAPTAFATALHNVTSIIHIASPMPGKGSDFEKDYLQPAVKGTTVLLDAAKEVNSIERVIIVSSLLAMMPLGALAEPSTSIVKEGINPTLPVDPHMTFPSDPQMASGLKYHGSKILAHRATLEWAATHRPPFAIVTLHPSFIFGRNLTQSSPAELSGSNAMLWASLTSPRPMIPLVAVDVLDVAAAHIKALDERVGRPGEVVEFNLSASEKEGWTWGRVAEFAREKYPEVDVKLESQVGEVVRVDTKQAEEVLGLEWRAMEDTVAAFLGHQVELSKKA